MPSRLHIKRKFLLSTPRKFDTLNSCDTGRSNCYLKTRLNFQRFRIQHQNLSFSIARVDVLAAPVERSDDIQVTLRGNDRKTKRFSKR